MCVAVVNTFPARPGPYASIAVWKKYIQVLKAIKEERIAKKENLIKKTKACRNETETLVKETKRLNDPSTISEKTIKKAVNCIKDYQRYINL